MAGSKRVVTAQDFYELSERKIRVSLDLDSHNQLAMLKAYFNLQHLFPYAQVSVDRTRHGYHVKAVGVEMPPQKNLLVRMFLGDCKGRVFYDKIKLRQGLHYMIDVLFTMKKGSDGKHGYSEKINPLSEPFWSVLPSRKS